jgi:hypothetical protein
MLLMLTIPPISSASRFGAVGSLRSAAAKRALPPGNRAAQSGGRTGHQRRLAPQGVTPVSPFASPGVPKRSPIAGDEKDAFITHADGMNRLLAPLFSSFR